MFIFAAQSVDGRNMVARLLVSRLRVRLPSPIQKRGLCPVFLWLPIQSILHRIVQVRRLNDSPRLDVVIGFAIFVIVRLYYKFE